jgi:hypothetical protein
MWLQIRYDLGFVPVSSVILIITISVIWVYLCVIFTNKVGVEHLGVHVKFEVKQEVLVLWVEKKQVS